MRLQYSVYRQVLVTISAAKIRLFADTGKKNGDYLLFLVDFSLA
jgi:hypothetical protein